MHQPMHQPPSTTKQDTYCTLLVQLDALLTNEPDTVANLANTAALLHQTFQFFWVGFYLVKNQELVLAPFQGPVACTRIQYGKGVCGTAWKEGKSIVVPDVEQFPGHIACNAQSKSEIVIPIRSNTQIIGVLDIDSQHLNHFDSVDEHYLNQVCEHLAKHHNF